MVISRLPSIFLFSLVSAIALGLRVSPPVVAQSQQISPEIRLRSDFTPNPLAVTGQSGSSLRVANIITQASTPTGPCLGYINASPNHILTLDAFFDDLAILVDSDQDTTLIIQGPGGVWCSDDAQGHNPAIEGQWQAGSYRIWVGSYSQGNAYPYRLIIRHGLAQGSDH